MHVDVNIHFPERFYDLMNAALSTQISRAVSAAEADHSTIASLSAALSAAEAAVAVEDADDAHALSTALDGAGVPPAAGQSVSAAA